MATRPGIIYLQKDRLQLYSPFLQQIVQLPFPPDVVRDSDVVNSDALNLQVKTLVTNGKIQPSSLIIVLSDNAYFVKDYMLPAPPPPAKPGQPPAPPPMSMETLQVLSMDFVEHVPYENVVSKTFPLKSGLKVCAVNKDFFDAVREAFEKVGFNVEAVIPGMVLGNNLSTKPTLDGSIINTTLAKIGGFKDYNLLHQEVYTPQPKKSSETSVEMEIDDFEEKKGKPDKKRLYMMLGVMGVLLVILGFVYTNQQNEPPVQSKVAVAPTEQAAPPTEAPTPEPTSGEEEPAPTEGPAYDPEEAKLLTVQLTNTAAPAIAVERLRTALGKFGFASLTTQSQPSVSTSQSIVIFSLAPSSQMRQAVLLEIKKVSPNVTVQERIDSSSDITILLGR